MTTSWCTWKGTDATGKVTVGVCRYTMRMAYATAALDLNWSDFEIQDTEGTAVAGLQNLGTDDHPHLEAWMTP